MISEIDLWNLKCFVEVADQLHFGRAARRLNMAQPTLSQQVRRLEHGIGVPLFSRTTRRVELTAAEEVLLQNAHEVLAKIDETILSTKLAAGGISPGGEQLNVAAIGPAAHRLLPRILLRFRKRFPET